MGDQALMEEMILLFLKNAPESLASLSILIEEQNWAAIAAAAHRFKPNLSYMGLNAAKAMLDSLENNARSDRNIEFITRNFALIQQNCERAYIELDRELKTLRYES